MTSNIAVKIAVDIVELQTKYALASAANRSLSSDFNKLAKEAVAAGSSMSEGLRQSLNQTAEAFIKSKTEVRELRSQLNSTAEEGGRFAGVVETMKSGLAALGVAFSIEKVIEFGRSIEENAAHLAHEAEVLQLSVTGYQAYREAAIDSGVETDIADQAIKRFSKSVSEAAVGTGPAAKALLEMGISTSQSKEAILQQVSAFMVHADAITRDRMATELFSRSGAELMPLFPLWAQGVDSLSQKYDALGRIMSPETAEKAHEAEIQWKQNMETLKVGTAGPVASAISGLSKLLGVMRAIVSTPSVKANEGFFGGIGRNFGLRTGAAAEGAQPNVIPKPKPMSEKDEIAALSALDGKLRERADLEKSIAIARKAQADAKGIDPEGYKKATQVVADLQKQLDSLNKTPFGGGFKDAGAKAISDARVQLSGISGDPTKSAQERKAEQDAIYTALLKDSRLNAAQRNQITEEMNRADIASDRETANQKRQIDESNAQTGVRLAQIELQQKRSILEEQVAAGQITKQQELASLIELTREEGRLQEEVVTKAEQGYARDTAFFQQKENEKKVIAAQTEAEIAAIRRQIQQRTNKEELQGQMSVLRELSSASNTFWGQIFSGRVGILGALQAAGLNFLQKELEQDTQYFLAHMLLSKAALASDQTIGQAGVLLHTVLEGQKTAATAAGEAARTGVKEGARAAGSAQELVSGSAQIMNDAAKAAAGAYSAVVGIPYVGPFLAPVAAATAFAAVAAFDTLTGLATGAYDIPNDGPAYLHQGEMVVPKTFATSLRENIRGGDTSSIANSTSVGGDQYEIHLHGVDHSNARQTGRDLIDALNYERRTRRSKFKN